MLSEICQPQRKNTVRFHLYEVPNESESEVAQSCPTPWDPMDYSPPGSAVHGILQARILEWVAISLSMGSSQPRDGNWVSHTVADFLPSEPLLLLLLSHFSRVRLCATLQMAAHQAPPSLGFSRQEHWSGLPFPFPGDLPNPEMEPESPALWQTFYPLSHSDQIRRSVLSDSL